MNPARTVFSALALTALLACEPVLEPEVSVSELDALSPAFAVGGGGGRVLESVTGSGHVHRANPAPDGQFRTFSIQAQKHADGTVSGTFQLNNHAFRGAVRGTITCFTIIGNQAWLGGAFLAAKNPFFVGREARLRVVDNGEGKNAAPDQISFIAFPPAGSGGAQRQCDNTPNGPLLRDIEKGNIRVIS